MEVYVTLAGTTQLPRLSVVIDLVVTMVCEDEIVKQLHFSSLPIPSPTVGEAVFEFGYPRRRYVAQNFSCYNFTYGLRNCNYSGFVDPECSDGPHVAGVRCRESKSFSNHEPVSTQWAPALLMLA